ncbi:hypothetical protein SAMN06265361_10423 [Laceyella tengchongensis]|uniref:Uncharacterized protein n=1 Tax=Laceyella tengchongensis TaxID=574699 RepID=A0AA45WPK1_9BACL|nr:hypothetical protein [Laceyella tengchongensis]SMP22243.1 hypothetical protein SAMN06265361_10423 [Laceyella tengchongensis]
MTPKLPVYRDAAQTKLDWEAHRAASFEDRMQALKPYLTGYVEEKFINFRDNSSREKNEAAWLGTVGEIEFLERQVFENKQIVEVLEDDRKEKISPKLEDDVTNPDFRIDKEIYEVKAIKNTSGKSAITSQLKKANNQIKNSGYDTPTYTKDQQPQGIASLQFIGEELKLSLEEISNAITKQCSPTACRSLKEVQVYHENELILKFARNEKNRMVEVPINRVTLNQIGPKEDILIKKLSQITPQQLNRLTCKFALVEKNGDQYICVHKNDRDNPSLKQLLGIDKDHTRQTKSPSYESQMER